MAADRPSPNRIDFSKLNAHVGKPPDWPPPSQHVVVRRKRSLIVGLIALGAGSVALSMAMSRKSCDEKLLANPNDPCKTASSRSGSGGWAGYASGSRSTGETSSPATGHRAISRGGFGATGSHFSGRGG